MLRRALSSIIVFDWNEFKRDWRRSRSEWSSCSTENTTWNFICYWWLERRKSNQLRGNIWYKVLIYFINKISQSTNKYMFDSERTNGFYQSTLIWLLVLITACAPWIIWSTWLADLMATSTSTLFDVIIHWPKSGRSEPACTMLDAMSVLLLMVSNITSRDHMSFISILQHLFELWKEKNKCCFGTFLTSPYVDYAHKWWFRSGTMKPTVPLIRDRTLAQNMENQIKWRLISIHHIHNKNVKLPLSTDKWVWQTCQPYRYI